MNLLHEIISSPWYIDKQYANDYFPLVLRILRGQLPLTQSIHTDQSEKMIGQAKLAILNQDNPFLFDAFDVFNNSDQIIEPSVFILNISGPITKYDTMCGPVGMSQKARWIQMADIHPNIFAHVLNIDSGGGSGFAARHMSEVISQLKKPVFTFFDDISASAAYWIGSSANYITMNSKMGRIGSIGTYITIADYSEALKMEGIKEFDVYADKSTEKNIEYRLLQQGKIDDAIARVQPIVNNYNEFFLSHVREARKSKLTSGDWETGQMFFASDALKIGLIDDIMPFDDFIRNIFYEFTPK